jgi:hypothetical protein
MNYRFLAQHWHVCSPENSVHIFSMKASNLIRNENFLLAFNLFSNTSFIVNPHSTLRS